MLGLPLLCTRARSPDGSGTGAGQVCFVVCTSVFAVTCQRWSISACLPGST